VVNNGAPYRRLGLLSVTRLTFTLTGATLRQVGHVAGGCLFIGDAEPTSLDMAGAVVFRVALTSGETFDGEVSDANRLGRQPSSGRSGGRRVVMDHHWHQRPVIGRPLRWLGRYLP